MGYDKPKHIGNRATGGGLAAPIVADFLKVALADKPAVPFRVPSGIKLIRVDAKTVMRVGPGAEGRIILEAFKPGTAPPDSYSVVGASDQAQQQDPGYISPTPDADRAARRGTGLY
jgi:penicillin-binding protein 1A